MAPRKTATAQEDVPVPAKAGPPKKSLGALLNAGKTHEDQERQSSGGRDKSYVQIVKDAKDSMLKPKSPDYIEGALFDGFVIPNKKIWLGMNPEVVIVGMFKIYEERIPVPPGSKEIPPLIGIWMPQDAEQVPVEGMFDRPFMSRSDNKMHVLAPAHWLCLFLPSHPDIDDAVITFRSIGNSVYQQLVKQIKQSGSEFAPQLKIKLKTQEKETNFGTKTYPDFEILGGVNFDFDKDGEPVTVKGGLNAANMTKAIELYAALAEEYSSNKMVSLKTNIAGLIAAPAEGAPRLAGAGKGGKVVAEDEEDGVTF